jgi:hypothetical protein
LVASHFSMKVPIPKFQHENKKEGGREKEKRTHIF